MVTNLITRFGAELICIQNAFATVTLSVGLVAGIGMVETDTLLQRLTVRRHQVDVDALLQY